jgi:hypothetical protein
MVKTKDSAHDGGHYHRESSPTYASAGDDGNGSSPGTVASIVVSTLLMLILLCIAGAFLFIYGKRNPGGMAERIAMRMESSYNRGDICKVVALISIFYIALFLSEAVKYFIVFCLFKQV